MESGPSASSGSVRKVAATVFLVAQSQEFDTLVPPHVAGRMNKRTGIILGGIFVVLLALGSLVWRPSARLEDPVVLRLKGYHWVTRQNLCYAQLELVNRSTNVVSYPVLQDDDLLRLSPTFTRADQSPGWQFRIASSSSSGTRSVMHTLAPGKTATLRVEVKRGGNKPSIGIPCDHVPARVRLPLEIWLRRVLQPLSDRLGLRIAPPELLEIFDQWIWCDSPMDPPPRPVEESSWQN